MGLQVKPAGK